MIICDGKHEKNVPGQASIAARGASEIGNETASVQISFGIPGQHFCEDCLMEKLKDLDVVGFVKSGLEARDKQKKMQEQAQSKKK